MTTFVKSTRKNRTYNFFSRILSSMMFVGLLLAFNNCTAQATFDATLRSIANELNKGLPMTIDKETTLDNAMVLPNKVFLYSYTLVNMEAPIDTLTAAKIMKPTMVNAVRTNPALALFRENLVTLAYQYKDKKGVYLLTIVVTPEDYAEKKQ